MKEGVASIVVVCLTLIFTNAQTVPFKELYIDQYVDHFNFVSYGETIFKERYLLQGLLSQIITSFIIQQLYNNQHTSQEPGCF